MIDPSHPIAKLLKEDRRYKIDAYAFVFEALELCPLATGHGQPSGRPRPKRTSPEEEERPKEAERHLTGQQLCEAIRQYALEQYGYMAQCVLNSWGVGLDQRLRRDRVQPDRHRPDAQDHRRSPRRFRQRVRFRNAACGKASRSRRRSRRRIDVSTDGTPACSSCGKEAPWRRREKASHAAKPSTPRQPPVQPPTRCESRPRRKHPWLLALYRRSAGGLAGVPGLSGVAGLSGTRERRARSAARADEFAGPAKLSPGRDATASASPRRGL